MIGVFKSLDLYLCTARYFTHVQCNFVLIQSSYLPPKIPARRDWGNYRAGIESGGLQSGLDTRLIAHRRCNAIRFYLAKRQNPLARDC